MAQDHHAFSDARGRHEWDRRAVLELARSAEACIGVGLPEIEDPTFDERLDVVRRRLEESIIEDGSGTTTVARRCRLLVAVDDLQRHRIDCRRSEIVECETFAGLATALAQLDIDQLLDRGASDLCRGMGFSRTLFSSVSRSFWIPRTVYIDPDHGDDAAAEGASEVRAFVADAAWRLEWAPLESDVIRRRSATIVDCSRQRHRTFGPLMDVTRSRSYVVAPVRARGRVIGLLHGDRCSEPVDGADLARLDAYAQCFGVAIDRATLRRRVHLLVEQATETLQTVAARIADVDREPGLLADLRAAPRYAEADGREHRRPGGTASAHRSGPPGAAGSEATPRSSRVSLLSPRELEVLVEMARGHSNVEIAARLQLTPGTVKWHVTNVLHKLRVHSRAAAAAALARHDTDSPDLAAR